MKTTPQMLRELVDEAEKVEARGGEELRWAPSMQDMWDRYTRGRLNHFSDKQKSYIRETHEKVFDEVNYENAWSTGKVPIGEALRTPVPEVLLKPLPMRPPGRK
jgi:hypothetical protein